MLSGERVCRSAQASGPAECIGPPNLFGRSVPITKCKRSCYELRPTASQQNSGAYSWALISSQEGYV
jgi:hypothetical protein